MDKNLELFLTILYIVLFLLSIGTFIYGIVALVQFFQLKKKIQNMPVVNINMDGDQIAKITPEQQIQLNNIREATVKLDNMKTTFITTIVIGSIGMYVFAVLLFFKKLQPILYMLFVLLLIGSFSSTIIGILSLTAVKDMFYNGDKTYYNIWDQLKKLHNYHECISTKKEYSNYPLKYQLKCGRNTDVISGVLIAFGLLGIIVSSLLTRKYKLYNVYKIFV
jgi:hypothetical protein